MVTNKLYSKWHLKKTCDFQGICLYETVKVAVSMRVMSLGVRWCQPNSLWKYPCAKGNLRYITLNSTILEIDTQWNLNKLLDQANHQQRSCGNESKNLTIASRPFLVSRRILGSKSGETFLNKSLSAGCRGHSLRTCSTVSSWPHSQLWFRSSMPLVRKYFPRTPWPVRSWNNLLKVWRDTLLMKDFSGLGYFPPYNSLLTIE